MAQRFMQRGAASLVRATNAKVGISSSYYYYFTKRNCLLIETGSIANVQIMLTCQFLPP
jgi:hypothetical protein